LVEGASEWDPFISRNCRKDDGKAIILSGGDDLKSGTRI